MEEHDGGDYLQILYARVNGKMKRVSGEKISNITYI